METRLLDFGEWFYKRERNVTVWPYNRITQAKGDRLDSREIFSGARPVPLAFRAPRANRDRMTGFSPIFWVFSFCRGVMAIVMRSWDGRGWISFEREKGKPVTFLSTSRTVPRSVHRYSDLAQKGSSLRRRLTVALDIMNGPVGSFYGNLQWRLAFVWFVSELVGLILKAFFHSL